VPPSSRSRSLHRHVWWSSGAGAEGASA
jgi:hypothetical protein